MYVEIRHWLAALVVIWYKVETVLLLVALSVVELVLLSAVNLEVSLKVFWHFCWQFHWSHVGVHVGTGSLLIGLSDR